MNIIKKSIQYLGTEEKPGTPNQVKVEIAGLKHLIKIVEEMICRYEQALAIMEMKKEEMLDDSRAESIRAEEKTEQKQKDESGNQGT